MVVQNRWLRQGFICLGALLFILISLSCFSAIAAEKPAAPAQITWNIPHLAQPPQIDGELGEWTNIIPVCLGVEKDQIRYYSLRPWAGPLDSSAKIWMGWDKDNLYFAADIRDDTFHQTCSSSDLAEIWSEDSLWLTIASADKTKQNGTVVLLSEFNWAIVSTDKVAIAAKRDTEGQKAGAFPVAARKKSDGTGCIYEGAIPWSEISLSARPGTLMRLSWAVGDSDTGLQALFTDIDADVDPKDLYTPDLIALLWPRSIGSFYKTWNFALATLSDAPPPTDSGIVQQAAKRAYQDLLENAKALKGGEALLWTAHVQALLNQENLAQESYLRVLKEYPKGMVAEQASASLMLLTEKTRDKQATLGMCEQILINYPHSIPAALPAVFEMAKLKQGDEGFEAARQEMRRLIGRFPGSEIEVAVHYVTGCLYQREGILKMAESQWVHLDTSHAGSQIMSRTRKELAQLRFKLAIDDYYAGHREAAARLFALAVNEPGWDESRQDTLAIYARWCCDLARDKDPVWFDEAYKANKKLIKLRTKPNDKLLARYDLAICLQGLGRDKEAIKEFRAILVAMNPVDKSTKELQDKCLKAIAENEAILSGKIHKLENHPRMVER